MRFPWYNYLTIENSGDIKSDNDLLKLTKQSITDGATVGYEVINDTMGNAAHNILFSMVSFVISAAAYIEQKEQISKVVNPSDRYYIDGKLIAFGSTMLATLSDLISSVVSKLSNAPGLRYSRIYTAIGRSIGKLDLLGGGISALIFSIYDGISTREMLRNGEYRIAGLYFISSALGILRFWALYAMSSSANAGATILGLALSWWVGIFALVMFGATLAIGFFIDTDIQEWIGKSYFGNYPENVRCVSLGDEQENFDKLKENV